MFEIQEWRIFGLKSPRLQELVYLDAVFGCSFDLYGQLIILLHSPKLFVFQDKIAKNHNDHSLLFTAIIFRYNFGVFRHRIGWRLELEMQGSRIELYLILRWSILLLSSTNVANSPPLFPVRVVSEESANWVGDANVAAAVFKWTRYVRTVRSRNSKTFYAIRGSWIEIH